MPAYLHELTFLVGVNWAGKCQKQERIPPDSGRNSSARRQPRAVGCTDHIFGSSRTSSAPQKVSKLVFSKHPPDRQTLDDDREDDDSESHIQDQRFPRAIGQRGCERQ